MFEPSSKKALLAVLVASFALQTALVYSDDTDLVLSEAAVEGRRLYHHGACQVCHQLWGQGGFLGPDLTNAASRVDETRLASLLTVGSGQMPAFHFRPDQIAAVRAFLDEIDTPAVGRGQLRLGDPAAGAGPQAAFEASVRAASPPPEAAAGFETFRGGACSTCHYPFQTSIVGAPDLSTVVERLDEAALDQVLSEGRPLKGMPPPMPSLDARQRAEVIAYFSWLDGNRPALMADARRRAAERRVDWSRLPWWEFR